jgi:hypothetical protein
MALAGSGRPVSWETSEAEPIFSSKVSLAVILPWKDRLPGLQWSYSRRHGGQALSCDRSGFGQFDVFPVPGIRRISIESCPRYEPATFGS